MDYLKEAATRLSAPSAKSPVSPSPSHGRQPSLEVIPRPKKWEPFFLRPVVAGITTLLLVAVAVAIEVMLDRSQKQQGFPSGPLNAFGSTQFLKSFLPALVAIPIAFLIKKGNESMRLLQPYVDLAKGGSPAEKSLLINYVGSNNYKVALKSLRKGHLLVTVSTIVVIGSTFISALASSLFTIRNTPFNIDATVISHGAIGLNPDVATLSPFVAAAGFVDAAVLHNLTDPPYIRGGWSIPPFELRESLSRGNATVEVKTPAVQSNATCVAADSITYAQNSTTNGFTMVGVRGICSLTVQIDSPSVSWQSGVVVAPSAYVPAITNGTAPPDDLADDFKPVVFWVFSHTLAKGSITFCNPSIAVQQVTASMEVPTNVLGNVTVVGPYNSINNVTGPDLNGKAYNGIGFILPATSDKFITARSIVAPATIADAILQRGRQLPGGLNQTLGNASAFPDITRRLYTQFLAISASSIYFTDADVVLPAVLIVDRTRIWVDPNSAHALAAYLATGAIILIFVYSIHYRRRRDLYIACEPGSLASAATVLAHSRFPAAILSANLDNEALEEKLKGLKFGFSKRTWAVEAEHYDTEDSPMGVGSALLVSPGIDSLPYSPGFSPGYPPSR